MSSIRNRTVFLGLIIILLALTVLRTALHLAGAAIRIILIVGLILFAIGWATSKVGRAR